MKRFLRRFLTALLLGGLFLRIYFYSSSLFSILLFFIFIFILFFEWPVLAKNNRKIWFLVPIYPFLPMVNLFYLNVVYRSIDILLPLYPFFVSWIADSFAYIAGRAWGKHKIWPRISPKKSWEGFVGGVLGVFSLNILMMRWWPLSRVFLWNYSTCRWNNGFFLVLFSIFLSIIALGGDLFESYLKRRGGIKDSGKLLPGHGGLLDRFDSVFFVGIAFTGWLLGI